MRTTSDRPDRATVRALRSVLPLAVAAVVLAACSALGGGGNQPSTSASPGASSSADATPTGSPGADGTGSASPSGTPATPDASGTPSGLGTPGGVATPGTSSTPLIPASPGSAAPPASGGGDQLGDVVATRTSSINGETVTMQLYPVQRDGVVSHVNLSLSASDDVVVSTQLSDGNTSQADRTPDAADGITLVDGVNAKLYLVASDGAGQCLCTRNLVSVRLADSQPVLVSATFAAPPVEVTTVDVRIPIFGTVRGVSVQ